MSEIHGVLLDIDGVLVVSWEPIPGASKTVAWLREHGVPFCLVTNTSSESRAGIAARLTKSGIPVEPSDVITAVVATGSYLRTHHPGTGAFVLSDEESLEDLGDVLLVDRDADVVVIGGANEKFSYRNVNRAFRMMMDGAALVGMHRSRYWKKADGLHLDGGAFLRGLEEAAGVEAVVCGKPAAPFFEEAIQALELPPDRMAMVGDDMVTDVLAAQDVGLTGVLVRTGKFRTADLERGSPDHVIGSIAGLPELLGRS